MPTSVCAVLPTSLTLLAAAAGLGVDLYVFLHSRLVRTRRRARRGAGSGSDVGCSRGSSRVACAVRARATGATAAAPTPQASASVPPSAPRPRTAQRRKLLLSLVLVLAAVSRMPAPGGGSPGAPSAAAGTPDAVDDAGRDLAHSFAAATTPQLVAAVAYGDLHKQLVAVDEATAGGLRRCLDAARTALGEGRRIALQVGAATDDAIAKVFSAAVKRACAARAKDATASGTLRSPASMLRNVWESLVGRIVAIYNAVVPDAISAVLALSDHGHGTQATVARMKSRSDVARAAARHARNAAGRAFAASLRSRRPLKELLRIMVPARRTEEIAGTMETAGPVGLALPHP